ncbi:serine/threonine-protein kinase [Nocardioides solisilvae]|uniref:serine/threonine-protein kinase n=1 Tax=Nocardioides solisilvae TaxID=1542435 RepID=UPI000D74EB35|nr:serine/threonine-protein kinase [Nocardioides solisilvae]
MTAPAPRIGPYVVGRRLGRGGVGVVHAAVPDPTGSSAPVPEVALKLLPGDLARDRDFRARFTREARTLAGLGSPHVVPVRGFGEEAGQLYVASDLVPDGDLERMLRVHGAPPLETALRLVLQVAQGLVDAHDAGLVHGALKPANVMLRREDDGFRACLVDFGTAHGAHPVAAGSARWAAPELHTGAPASRASDVYSLGCVLWTTLTGHPPYDGATDFQQASAHLQEPPRQLAGGSPLVLELNALLERTMAKDPARRPASARQVADVLRRVQTLAGARDGRVVPVPARSAVGLQAGPGAAARGGSGARSWRSRLGVAAGVAAALVVGVVGTLLLVDRESSAAPAASISVRSGEGAEGASPLNPEARAVNDVAEGLEVQLMVDHANARCIAGLWVEQVGLGRLLAAGLLDADLRYTGRDLEKVDPDIKELLGAATRDCLA